MPPKIRNWGTEIEYLCRFRADWGVKLGDSLHRCEARAGESNEVQASAGYTGAQ